MVNPAFAIVFAWCPLCCPDERSDIRGLVSAREDPGVAALARATGQPKQKRRSCLRRFDCSLNASHHCSSFSTLCCDWLASASAETAIDWRVDSAWLLAASSLVSAKVRLDEPVCSTLIRFLLKSWRICTTDRLEPSVEASVRSVVLAAPSFVSTPFVELLSRKSVPDTSEARPRPAAL